jgi:hypothetical protein
MKPLFELDRDNLKTRLGHDPTRMELTREWVKQLGTKTWWRHAGEAGKFVAMDPVYFFKESGHSLKAHFTQPGGLRQILKNDAKAIRTAVRETRQYFKREKTELPPALAPHHQARLGAIIGAITNVPMIMWGSNPEFVKKMLVVSAILGTPGKLTLFLQTLEDRDAKDFLTRLKNWWIRAAILPSYYLDMKSQHDWSVGAGRLAMGVPFQLYQIADIHKKDQKEQEEAAKKKKDEAV